MKNILIVDDTLEMRYALKRIIESAGYTASIATSLNEGLTLYNHVEFSTVFLDVCLPDGNGLDFISKFKSLNGSPEIICITGYGSEEDAEIAIKRGAWDYISKNSSIEELTEILHAVIDFHNKKQNYQENISFVHEYPIIGKNYLLNESVNSITKYAQTDANILILGETGTGKELLAKTIHENSLRKNEPFITVDCASIHEELIQSILFGHAKGAFTSAHANSLGIIQQAENGTLFLDEIGELSLVSQKVLLRVLQEKIFTPVGSSQTIKSNFRLISATNKDLPQMVKAEMFREDLFFRIQTSTLTLSPLRIREDDILTIADYFVKYFSKAFNLKKHSMSQGFIQAICEYQWPGNIRELRNAIEYAIIAAHKNSDLLVQHLPINIKAYISKLRFSQKNIKTEEQALDAFPTFFEFSVEQKKIIEKNYLDLLFDKAGNSTKKRMELSGLSKSRYYALLQKHSISS